MLETVRYDGADPTLVFLHEGLGSARMWRDFPEKLASATGCSALVYSRAGYGWSDPAPLPRPVSYMHDEALVLGGVLRENDVRDFILVGHSDGASIAIIYAGALKRAAPLALILEAPHVFTEPHGLASIAKMKTTFASIRHKLAKYHKNPDDAFRGWNDIWLDPEFRAWNIEEFLPKISAPILLIQGEDDQYGTWKQIDAIASQVRGPVEIVRVARCGHSPHRDQPKIVLDAMTKFVNGVRASQRA